MSNLKATSRPVGVAEKLLNKKIDRDLILSKTVMLTGESGILQSTNGKWCFTNSLRLLSRVVGSLTVLIPADNEALQNEVSQIIEMGWCAGDIKVLTGNIDNIPDDFDAILMIGSRRLTSHPCTVINSNGWIARVASTGHSIPDDVNQANPIASLMAASLGVTEIFKRIYEVPEDIAPLIEVEQFSLYEGSIDFSSLGPALPLIIKIPDTLIVGGGAIGNGLALLLSQLPVEGNVLFVDKQNYGDENFGTSILINSDWVGKSKAEMLKIWLGENSRLTLDAKKAFIEDIKSDLHTEKFCIDLILNGLDDVNARHATQDIWPRIIIDGGINEIGAAVVQYRLDQSDLACLKCWFELPQTDERIQQSKQTGLSIDALSDMQNYLTDEDIAKANADMRPWLKEQQQAGKKICSIISEAALSNQLGVNVEEGFRPSVPFVATAAASLVIAEAVKAIIFPDLAVTPKVQINNLFLGTASMKLKMKPRQSCKCVIHGELIRELRVKRLNKFKSMELS